MNLSIKGVVVDTNILVSSALSSKGNPTEIMNLISDNKIQLFYCSEILDEYIRVLTYKRLNILPQTQRNIITAIEDIGILVEPTVSNIFFSDESDRVFYDTARASKAALITGNLKHYPTSEFIKTPAEFLTIYKNIRE